VRNKHSPRKGRNGDIPIGYSGRAVLRREQREELENRATGKEGEADHRRQEHSPRKRRNGGAPVGYSGRIALRSEQYST
jgi:hypothetical protein